MSINIKREQLEAVSENSSSSHQMRKILEMTKEDFLEVYNKNGYVIPGFMGYDREKVKHRLDSWFGDGNWSMMHRALSDSYMSVDDAITFYEQSYKIYFEQNPQVLEDLLNSASNIYDTHPSNIKSGTDYNVQEEGAHHIQDIAIRRIIEKQNKNFRGNRLVQIRGKRSEGYHLSPGNIPFVFPEMIPQISFTGAWWKKGSVEDFYQSSRVIMLNKDMKKAIILKYPFTKNRLDKQAA